MSLHASMACIGLVLVGIFTTPVSAQDAPPNPRVLVETSEGDFEIELFKDRAPVSVVNFLTYVQAGFYDGTVFHRVIRDAIVQGGGLVAKADGRITPKLEGLRGQILNEATNNLQNRRGTVAMARLAEPNSARSQFFINLDDNGSFNHTNGTAQGFGYAVFGRVIEGMNVVLEIGSTRTTNQGDYRDVPSEPIVIRSIRQIETN